LMISPRMGIARPTLPVLMLRTSTQDGAAVCVEHTHVAFAVVRHEDTPGAPIDCYRTGG
jgi:hypothetical protein